MANPEDHAIAARIATQAGELLVDLRERLFAQGADSWTVKDTGDLEAHRFIHRALRDEFPNDGILSEWLQVGRFASRFYEAESAKNCDLWDDNFLNNRNFREG